MECFSITDNFPILQNTAVTLGKFDGLHKGHQKLIENTVSRKEFGEKACMVAFSNNGKMIQSIEERRRYLKSRGLDILIECPLTEELRSMKAEEFVRQVLVGDLRASYICVGEDFRFGYKRKGDPELLKEMGREMGFELKVVSKEMEGSRKISSTYVREQLLKGNMEHAARLLGRPYVIEGRVEHGRGMGHHDFFPTVNVRPPKEKLLPPNGVYVTRVHFEDADYTGVTNIGRKPTVGEDFTGTESYLFDCDRDLYGKYCTTEYLHYLRPEKKFSSYTALRQQIATDIENARERYSSDVYLNLLTDAPGSDEQVLS